MKINKKQEVALWLVVLPGAILLLLNDKLWLAFALVAILIVFSLRDRARTGSGLPPRVGLLSRVPWMPSVIIAIALVLSVFVSAGKAWFWQSAQSFGAWLGGLIFPLLIAEVAYRMRGRKANTFAFWFLGAVLGFALMTNIARLGDDDARAQAVVHEAIRDARVSTAESQTSSDTPSQQGTEEQRSKKALAEIMRDFMAIRRDYENAVAKFDLKSWNTPESFASTERIRTTKKAMSDFIRIEEDFYNRHSLAMSNAPKKAAQYLSGDELDRFVKGFNGSRDDSVILPKAAAALKAEREWIDSEIQLYDYAERKANAFTLQKGQLEATDDATQQEFNVKVEHMSELQNRYRSLAEEVKKLQGELGKKIGVSSSDLSAPK